MRFSIWPSPAQPWDDIHEITAYCEQTGWDGVYFADHFMPNGPGPQPLDGDILECWSIIAALAATVPRLRIAPLVTSVTYRHPTLLANIAAAVDQVSGGRLTLGVGAGWQLNEHAAYGLPLGSPKERLDRFEEALRVLLPLLREPRTTMVGDYYQVRDAPNQPAPVQDRMPLLIGGAGEKRMLGIVARYADEWNAWAMPELLAHKLSVLREHCGRAGRDPAEIHVSTQALVYVHTGGARPELRGNARAEIAGTPAELAEIMARYRDAGAQEFIVPDGTLGGSLAEKQDVCDLLINEVAAGLR